MVIGQIGVHGVSVVRAVEPELNIVSVPAQIRRQVNTDYPVTAYPDSNQKQISSKESMINGNMLEWKKILI